ncbi:MAG: L-aspartate oxidase [Proteobacteria bacterium]|jgi:L-aspartate oxidase|nr:L-aspartate oxidase [Pseudomonadota bacterium]
MTKNHAEVLIIGGGVAGLSLSLRLAHTGVNVTLISKDTLSEGSSLYAQGGIAAVLDKDDSFTSHIEDTLTAGAELCNPQTVRFVVENAPKAIDWLINNGVEFSVIDGPEYDGDDSQYHLTREGGHSHRRVIHAQDATGREVATTLEKLVRDESRISILEHHIAIDLVTAQKLELTGSNRVVGAYILDTKAGKVSAIAARSVVIATGGASKSYLYTSNPDTSTGDGIAMAWRVGCRIANMEFVQFHPTCLYHPHAKSSLISEAVRGEGGRLLLPDGSRFMKQHHKLEELAPRDIVARAIDYEMKLHGLDSVFLDISHKPKKFVLGHFPNIYKNCMQYGFDISKEPVPVVPAAHYTCGGVMTDLNGCTDLANLYCIGEASCTGLHGANRLASNSLLECLVLAKASAEHISTNLTQKDKQHSIPDWDESRVTDPDERIVVSHNWDELRRFMWDYVGIVRTDKRLERAAHRIKLLQEEIRDYYSNFKVSSDLLELRNLVTVADLIVQCALKRRESRGLHYTLDCPDTKDVARDSVIVPSNYAAHSNSVSW